MAPINRSWKVMKSAKFLIKFLLLYNVGTWINERNLVEYIFFIFFLMIDREFSRFYKMGWDGNEMFSRSKNIL